MRNFVIPLVWLVVALIPGGCNRNEGPANPEPALLIFPENLSECTTGIDRGNTQSRVTLEWQAAANTFDYEVTVQNLSNPGDRRVLVTSETTQEVILSKGVAYSWSVLSRNEDESLTARSEEWMFLNGGNLQSYPPFPADLQAPLAGERLAHPINSGQVSLRWSVRDLDNDITRVEVFFSDDEDPLLFETVTANSSSLSVPVNPDTRYYWRIRVEDSRGNSALSNIQDFYVRP